jgi:hypothetical protein
MLWIAVHIFARGAVSPGLAERNLPALGWFFNRRTARPRRERPFGNGRQSDLFHSAIAAFRPDKFPQSRLRATAKNFARRAA